VRGPIDKEPHRPSPLRTLPLGQAIGRASHPELVPRESIDEVPGGRHRANLALRAGLPTSDSESGEMESRRCMPYGVTQMVRCRRRREGSRYQPVQDTREALSHGARSDVGVARRAGPAEHAWP
jgi:hypothetical protein